MTPDALFAEVMRYRNWCVENAIVTTKVVSSKDHGPFLLDHPKPRAMSTMGCCVFMVITQGDWARMRSVEELNPVILMAEEAFRAQNFEGAAIDLFNSTFIARHLGMAEKRELLGPGGNALFPEKEMTEEELLEEAKRRGIPADLFQ